MYMSPFCAWCNKARAWFKKKKIKLEERDITESTHGQFRDEIIEKTGQMAVPVIDIDGKIFVGFDEKTLEKEIKG